MMKRRDLLIDDHYIDDKNISIDTSF